MQYSDKYIAKSTAIASRVLGDEAIIMSTLDSTLFSLNPVGTAIWEAADGSTPLSRIVEGKVCAEFEVNADQARADVEEFVEKMVQHGILIVSEEPIQRNRTP